MNKRENNKQTTVTASKSRRKARRKQSDASVRQKGKFVRLTNFADVPPPRKSWGIDQLDPYIQVQCEQIRYGERKLAIHTYRLGQALLFAKPKVGHGEWGKFLKKHRISDSTWSRARQLVERANEADLSELGITGAYLKYGILTQPVEEPDTQAEATTGTVRKTPKQKAAATKVAAKKTSESKKPTTAKPSTPPTMDASEDDDVVSASDRDDDNLLDSGEVWEEHVKKFGWGLQEQIQALVEYWGNETVVHLICAVGDAADFKEFLDEVAVRTAPPKENPDSPLTVLVMIRNRLELLTKDTIDWQNEPADNCRPVLNQIVEIAQQMIGKAVAQ